MCINLSQATLMVNDAAAGPDVRIPPSLLVPQLARIVLLYADLLENALSLSLAQIRSFKVLATLFLYALETSLSGRFSGQLVRQHIIWNNCLRRCVGVRVSSPHCLLSTQSPAGITHTNAVLFKIPSLLARLSRCPIPSGRCVYFLLLIRSWA